MSDDAETCVIAKGPLATRAVETVDQIEPELITFVRNSVLRLEPTFPQSGGPRIGQKGQFKGDNGVQTLFTQVEELDVDGRGIRVIRYIDVAPSEEGGGPYECAITVAAIGLANGATLTLRWNFITSGEEVRGTSAALFVSGVGKEQCILDFRDVFDVITS